jgi:hypothetical protein
MLGDKALVALLRGVLDGTIEFGTFEREFLAGYKNSPVENPALQAPLGRAFLAVEAYDPSVTPSTETVHNISYQGMLRELRVASEEIDALPEAAS